MIKEITICGSMKFIEKITAFANDLREKGFITHFPESEESESFYADLPANEKPALKKKFIDIHLDKIKRSDAILVCNYEKHSIEGYVGPNTLLEIAFAYTMGKKIFILNRLSEQPCKEEVEGLDVVFLDDNLSQIVNLQGRS